MFKAQRQTCHSDMSTPEKLGAHVGRRACLQRPLCGAFGGCLPEWLSIAGDVEAGSYYTPKEHPMIHSNVYVLLKKPIKTSSTPNSAKLSFCYPAVHPISSTSIKTGGKLQKTANTMCRRGVFVWQKVRILPLHNACSVSLLEVRHHQNPARRISYFHVFPSAFPLHETEAPNPNLCFSWFFSQKI